MGSIKKKRKRNVNLNVIRISEYIGIGNYRDAYQFSLGDSTSNVTITVFFVLAYKRNDVMDVVLIFFYQMVDFFISCCSQLGFP